MADNKHANPFHGVVDVVNEMSRMNEQATAQNSAILSQRHHADAWSPPTEILARGSDLLIRCELAGLSPDEVEVSLSSGNLTIIGNRPDTDPDDAYYVRERYRGRFRRVIGLPEDTTSDQITSHLEQGVLEVTVHDAAESTGGSMIKVRGGP